MTAPFFVLLHLVRQLENLDTTQLLIDLTRTEAPENQVIQLELDRRQTDLNLRRARINITMLDIRTRN